MTYTVYLVVEDDEGDHVWERGLARYDDLSEAEALTENLMADMQDVYGVEPWEVE